MNNPYEDAYAAHFLLRKLGFGADDIFVGCVHADVSDRALTVQLRTQGKSFNIVVADMGHEDSDKVNERWTTYAQRAADGSTPKHILQSAFDQSKFGRPLTQLTIINLLQKRGFHIPDLPKELRHEQSN